MADNQLLLTAFAFVDAHNSRQDSEIIGLSSKGCRHVRRRSSTSSVSSLSSEASEAGDESSEAYAREMQDLFGRLSGGEFRYHLWAVEFSSINQADRVVTLRGHKKTLDEHGDETMRPCQTTLRMTADGKKVEFQEDVYV
ncbi:hypothetical protein GQ53DRAFT_818229 [Thozetella sp. PMI_491]|nr:hypothetical protein GQ53DRAFT_818229 [Thozetella sp. PMI_491]